MAEWITVCSARRHLWNAVPADGCYVSSGHFRYWFCKSCAAELGVDFKLKGYKWEPLRATPPAQPSSERVQP